MGTGGRHGNNIKAADSYGVKGNQRSNERRWGCLSKAESGIGIEDGGKAATDNG